MTDLFNIDDNIRSTISTPTAHLRLVAGNPPVLQQMWQVMEVDYNSYTRKSYHEWRNVEIVEAPKE